MAAERMSSVVVIHGQCELDQIEMIVMVVVVVSESVVAAAAD